MQSIPMERTQAQVQVNAFVRSVYNWMAIGLALTGAVAWFVAHNEPVLRFVYQARWIFFIGELALVFMLASRVHKMKASTATGMFMFYAALNGATMSFIFLAYTMSSIASTFFICAGTFAVCSVLWMGNQAGSHRPWQLFVHGVDWYYHCVRGQYFFEKPCHADDHQLYRRAGFHRIDRV
jgi:FtsH-binding integral membrane protein